MNTTFASRAHRESSLHPKLFLNFQTRLLKNVTKDMYWSDLMVHIHLTKQVGQSVTLHLKVVVQLLTRDGIAKYALMMHAIHVLYLNKALSK